MTDGDGTTSAYTVGDCGPNDYGTYAHGYGGAGYGYNAFYDMGDGSTSCSGQITSTFTWQPSYTGEPPPTQVIVHETCEAGYGDDGDPAGTADDGLGDTASDYEPATYSCQRSAGERYTVQDGGQTVIVYRSPSATASSSDSADSWVSWVAYNVDVSPVAISLTGTTHDESGGDNILIGQGCTASLEGVPSACTVSGYEWTVSGTPFQTWSPTTPAIGGSPANPNASYYVSGEGPVNEATAHWYWNEAAATETVTCTVFVTPPAGCGAALTINPSHQISVAVPSYTPSNEVGGVQLNDTRPGQTGNYWLYAGPGPSDSPTNGINWYMQVTTPSLFGTGGQWETVQLITVGRTRTPNGGTAQSSAHTGETGSDGTSPYGSTYAADGTQYREGDSPGNSVEDAYSAYTASDSFSDYFLYQPPGSDSMWVPFYKQEWSWSASVSRPGTSWSNWNPATSAGTIPSPSGTDYHGTHPAWTSIPNPAW